ncbi:MAG: ribosome small subunit-dependent GTPase A [Magnetococcales bacterium]|nr:ribosome small subunit-dependent GTPase A [Magnetococcales bacterium]
MPRKIREKQLSLRQMARMRVTRRPGATGLELPADESALGPEEEGRVVAHFGLNVEVETESRERVRCAVRESLLEEPVCGDRVVCQRIGADQGVIVAVHERLSVLRRPGPHQRLLTMAANVERIVVVSAASTLNPGLLDRYLIAAQKAGIEPLLVINKIDQRSDAATLETVLAPYPPMGYPLFRVSALLEEGIENLEEALRDKTAIFVGESGVGKSSLINRMVPEESLRTAEVHAATGLGRHATTTARLYRLKRGGFLIDSPGVREFGLHGVIREEIPGLMRDMAPRLGQCRFKDCRHLREPDCALRAAVEAGEITAARLESMRRIADSVPSRNPYY